MNEATVRDAIISMAGLNKPMVCQWGICKSITGDVCDVEINKLVIQDVRLGFEKSHMLVKPVIGTKVLVLFVNESKTHGVVVCVEKTQNIEALGANYDGLVKVNELTQRLNAIENCVNGLITIFNSHTHIVNSPSVPPVVIGNTLLPIAPYTQVLVPTVKTQIENPLIKHGNGL